eukprot:1161998-Pelagomonas_calceolata.AAC.5
MQTQTFCSQQVGLQEHGIEVHSEPCKLVNNIVCCMQHCAVSCNADDSRRQNADFLVNTKCEGLP